MMRPLLVAFFATALLAACATPTTEMATFAPPPVPAPLIETMPNPPVSGERLQWQPGHWNWSGSGYVWQPGEYVPATGHGPLFQPGYWAQTPTGWVWQPARWTS
jgi:hypothetical protein